MENKNKTCKDCYWYSDVTVECCELDHEPTKAENKACAEFDPIG